MFYGLRGLECDSGLSFSTRPLRDAGAVSQKSPQPSALLRTPSPPMHSAALLSLHQRACIHVESPGPFRPAKAKHANSLRKMHAPGHARSELSSPPSMVHMLSPSLCHSLKSSWILFSHPPPYRPSFHRIPPLPTTVDGVHMYLKFQQSLGFRSMKLPTC